VLAAVYAAPELVIADEPITIGSAARCSSSAKPDAAADQHPRRG